MQARVIRRYSVCFKQQVIAALEAGRFESLGAARMHYGIGGCDTIQQWLRRYGRNHLQARVVRVEKPGEANMVRELRRKIVALERALGQTQAQSMLHAAFLKRACEELGEEVEAFKKKSGGELFMDLPGKGK